MTWCRRELSLSSTPLQESRKYNVCQDIDSYSEPGFQCHMQAASVLTFINKQTFIDEDEMKKKILILEGTVMKAMCFHFQKIMLLLKEPLQVGFALIIV